LTFGIVFVSVLDMLKTVYHPVTNEPFELLETRANRLVLEQGWLQTPIDPTAEPAVQDVERPQRGKKSAGQNPSEPVDWRGTDEGSEDASADPAE
jgi:hypothetical protein